jgi:hypothetical protein
LTAAYALVTNFFCRFSVPKEMYSDHGWNFETGLMQDVLERLTVSKTRTTPVHLQSGGMMKRCVKTIEEHLRKEVSSQQQD